jgi:hypothetical protein
LKTQWLQNFIERPLFKSLARNADMLAARVAGGGHLAFAQRMTFSHNANVTIPEQGLHTQFGGRRLFHHTGFQMDDPGA